MKLLITGGHVTPALAVIEELKKHSDITVIFVGRQHVLEGDDRPSFEYQAITRLGVAFISLTTGRFTRIFSLKTILQLFHFPIGLSQAYTIIRQEKPDAILSFGGYIALPMALVAYCLQIPVFTHEQTLIPGLTNRIITYFSHKVFLSFPETEKYFDKRKTLVTGNPLRTSIFEIIKKPFNIVKDRPVIYVTGGSLGSHSINILIEAILPRLLIKYIVIHQTGDTEQYRDFERLSRVHHPRYYLKKHFSDDEIGYIYSLADVVVGRSGANTIMELIALGKPAVLLPLPWSAAGEQKAQALFLKNKGVAEVVEGVGKADLRSLQLNLLSLINQIVDNKEAYQRNCKQLVFYYKKHAAQTIISHLLSSA